ncbi:hypothetical protein ACFYU9_25195 [Streptomyces sp. NPDC004327]|uniref:hypothetical protein n=1 Tax=unclassified Streptomyces TaxID=2593676 RepID=UPI00367DB379
MTSGSDFRLTWTLRGPGWADCVVEDRHTKAEVTASSLTNAPEELLAAVARLVDGAEETRCQFEAEPTAYRWIFYREGEDIWGRVLELSEGSVHDNRGTEIWSRWLTVDQLALAAIRCFDEVAEIYGESSYRSKWGEHFPRAELEALRCLRRPHLLRRDT